MKRLIGRPGPSLAVAAIALLLAGGGYALASSRGTITVCVHKADHGLYTGRCAKGDNKLTWNKTGPRGPVGARGQTGATGQPGAPGPPATSLWALVRGGTTPSIVYSKGVSSVSLFSTGTTLVTFSQNVSQCTFVATPASTGGGYYANKPTAQISEEFYSGGWGADGRTVAVNTIDSSGLSNYTFSIAAFC